RHGDYRTGYLLLLASTVLALATLTVARHFFPNPSQLEAGRADRLRGFGRRYWLYLLGGMCVAAGLVSFELISFHFARTRVVDDRWIPVLFAVAMGTDGIA